MSGARMVSKANPFLDQGLDWLEKRESQWDACMMCPSRASDRTVLRRLQRQGNFLWHYNFVQSSVSLRCSFRHLFFAIAVRKFIEMKMWAHNYWRSVCWVLELWMQPCGWKVIARRHFTGFVLVSNSSEVLQQVICRSSGKADNEGVETRRMETKWGGSPRASRRSLALSKLLACVLCLVLPQHLAIASFSLGVGSFNVHRLDAAKFDANRVIFAEVSRSNFFSLGHGGQAMHGLVHWRALCGSTSEVFIQITRYYTEFTSTGMRTSWGTVSLTQTNTVKKTGDLHVHVHEVKFCALPWAHYPEWAHMQWILVL